jgi:predicted glutamine amidotransferase
MCELMALSFAGPVSAAFSVREFAARGEENADGWGLAWYPDQSLAVAKEPVKWATSKYTGFLENYPGLHSKIYIAHVRHKTTGGEPTHADTHPFARELGGRDYCFAHNGTIAGYAGELPLGRFRPVGRTDSEHVFCHLMEDVAGRADALDTEAGWKWLHGKLAAVNRLGKINCLLTDGTRLFCYRDVNGWKGLTFRRVRLHGGKARHFEDAQVQVTLAGKEFDPGVVVATRPLSATGWEPLHPGELIALEAGRVVYSSHRPV